MMGNVSVIARCPHQQDLRILETLLIKEINPSMNIQLLTISIELWKYLNVVNVFNVVVNVVLF